jgi:CubicO group peptidase (beta-lactamase class C family)
MRCHTVCVATIWLAAASAHGQSLAGRLDPLLSRAVEEQHIPGLAIGVVQNGKLVYARGFGTMEVGKDDRPVTTQTLFHMASITKTFVATSIMQLWEQGKVDLDAPVRQYVPYFQLRDARAAAITVRQMLTHTSGMPDVNDYEWDKPQYDDGALERYVRSLSDRKLLWAPGTKFAYSNMAFEVVGDLVAKVSGQSFEDYVEAHILEPLGMSSSTLLLRKANAGLLAAGHTKGTAGSMKVVKHYPYNRTHTPSSDLHSNVDDMARWAIANLNRG